MTPDESIEIVGLNDVERISLPKESWSRMLITDETVGASESCLGFSRFTPGTVTDPVSHEVEEVAFVIDGEGELRLDDETVTFRSKEAMFIPPDTWHAVANTGVDDLVMVFAFPYPNYPPTERR